MNSLTQPLKSFILSTILSAAFPCLGLAQAGWQPTTPYPISGYHFDPAEADGFIFVSGGYDGNNLSNVFSSRVQPNGSLGAWNTGPALPEADAGPGAAVYKGWIYVVLASGNVYRAQIQTNGTLGSWITEASVEPSASYATAFKAYNGFLYLFGAFGAAPLNVVRLAPVHPDGSLGSWGVGSMPLPLHRPSVHFHNNRAYLAGGLTTFGFGNAVSWFSYSAPLNLDGSLGAWRQEADLPLPLWYQGSVLVSNQLLLCGGLTNAAANSQSVGIYQGTISLAGGAISNWVTLDQMPSTFSTGPGTVFVPANGNVYLIGGLGNTAGQFTNEVWHKVFLPVLPTNQPPVANPQVVSTARNVALAITLTGSDPDGDSLAFSVVAEPTNGTLSGVAPDLTYLPNLDYEGPDAFSFKVNDGQADSAVALVNISVTGSNQPPVAKVRVWPLAWFPGVTNSIVISPNAQSAVVVLDGTQSSDPDQDLLQFFWFDGTNALAADPVTTNSLAVGSHPVTLVVSDAQATASDTVFIEVITPAEAVLLVVAMVEDSSLPPQRKRPLLASLKAAASSFARGSPDAAVNQLRIFQLKVRSQVGRFDRNLAREWILVSEQIIKTVTGRSGRQISPD